MEPVPVVSNDIYFISLALFGTLWAMTALPFAHYVIRALRAGNLWLPFERKPNSRYTHSWRRTAGLPSSARHGRRIARRRAWSFEMGSGCGWFLLLPTCRA